MWYFLERRLEEKFSALGTPFLSTVRNLRKGLKVWERHVGRRINKEMNQVSVQSSPNFGQQLTNLFCRRFAEAQLGIFTSFASRIGVLKFIYHPANRQDTLSLSASVVQ